jgi:23S rRNA pseudouridine1911/1915/1917 synthase
VEGVLPRSDTELNVPLRRMPGSVLQMAPAVDGGTSALTQVHLEEAFGHFSLLRLRPLTGRQHQVRVHLSAAGYPPLVDALYGRREQLSGAGLNRILGARVAAERAVLLGRCPLHASALRYRPPSASQPRLQECPLAADMAALLELLRRVDPPRRRHQGAWQAD